ncbi:nucleotide exchange factor GrpE [Dermabacteraceae bacterium P13101]
MTSPVNENAHEGEEKPGFSFTDKRKVDPESGSVRESGSAPAGQGEAAAAEPTDSFEREAEEMIAAERAKQEAASDAPAEEQEADEVAQLRAKLVELEEERRRDQAEYVNSRRRIEAAAQLRTDQAVGSVLTSLVSVLDDIDRGRAHGELSEGSAFYPVANKLVDTLAKHGLTRFGEVGDEFDPTLHEALMHESDEDAETTTVASVLQAGYMLKERVLRPARVATKGPQ